MRTRKVRGSDSLYLMHWCPGCQSPHGFPVEGKNAWSFNGDWDRPHCDPSVLHSVQTGTLCHYFVHGGKIEFCSDCPHTLAGKTVDIPEWPYAPGSYGGIEEP